MQRWISFLIIILMTSACNLSGGESNGLPQTAIPISASPVPENSQLEYWIGSQAIFNFSSIRVGCETYVTPFSSSGTQASNSNERIFEALQFLFDTAPLPDTLNYWHNQGLQVTNVEIDINGLATIAISGDVMLGGVCSDPTMLSQILLTIFSEPSVQSAYITIGGHNMKQIFDMRGLVLPDAIYTRDDIPYN